MVLSREQIDRFWNDGYLVAEDAVTPDELASLNREMSAWVEESRAHDGPFGPPTVDGRARFDVAPEHRADAPALRRVNNPSEISEAYMATVRGARVMGWGGGGHL